MEELPEKELTYLTALLDSIPAVFERRCSINDMDFILSCLKQTICHRGVSKNAQRLLIHTLVPLSSFKVGLMGSQELKENAMHIINTLGLQIQLTGAKKVGSVRELKSLAVELCSYSRRQCLKEYISKGLSMAAGKGKVSDRSSKCIVYSREKLFSLRRMIRGCTQACIKIPSIIARRPKHICRNFMQTTFNPHYRYTARPSRKRLPTSDRQINRKKKVLKQPNSHPSHRVTTVYVPTNASLKSPASSPTLNSDMQQFGHKESNYGQNPCSSPSRPAYHQITELPSSPPAGSIPNCTSSPISPWECIHRKGTPHQGSNVVFNFV